MFDSRLARSLSLKQLRLLCLLAEERNLSRAAVQLHTSQPAVSRMLAQTEALVGHRLFDRSTKRMVVTAAGSRLVHHAQRVLDELGRADLSLQAIGTESRVELRVGMIGMFSPELMALALSDLQSRMPSLVVRVAVQPPQVLLEQLLDGAVDVMLSHVEFPVDLNKVEVAPLYEEHNLVLCAPDHALTRRRRLSWRDMARQSWVLPSQGTPLRPKLDRMLALHRSREAVTTDIETDSAVLAVQLVRSRSMLWAIASRHAQQWLDLGAVSALSAPETLIKGPFCCLTTHQAGESIAVRHLIESLQALR